MGKTTLALSLADFERYAVGVLLLTPAVRLLVLLILNAFMPSFVLKPGALSLADFERVHYCKATLLHS